MKRDNYKYAYGPYFGFTYDKYCFYMRARGMNIPLPGRMVRFIHPRFHDDTMTHNFEMACGSGLNRSETKPFLLCHVLLHMFTILGILRVHENSTHVTNPDTNPTHELKWLIDVIKNVINFNFVTNVHNFTDSSPQLMFYRNRNQLQFRICKHDLRHFD